MATAFALWLAESLAAIAAEASPDWKIDAVRGTALQLVNSAWVEIESGDPLVTLDGLRTMRNSGLTLRWHDAVIDVGADAAISLSIGGKAAAQSSLVVQQFSGTVSFTATGGAVEAITVRATGLEVSSQKGQFTVSFAGGKPVATVISGTAEIADPKTGQALTITAGETSSEVVVAAAKGNNGKGPPSTGNNGVGPGGNNTGGNGGGNSGNNGDNGNNGGNGGGNNGNGNGSGK